MRQTAGRSRRRISATVDPLLLRAVDAYVEDHPDLDRSKVIDEALALWYAKRQDEAMLRQFADPADVDPDEWSAWESIQRAAAQRVLQVVEGE